MELPKGVHRVVSRGHAYYYWQPGRGTPAAEKRVALPDPEADPVAFAAKVRLLQGRPKIEPGTIAELIVQYRGDEDEEPSAAWSRLKPATQKDYGWHLNVIRERWGDYQAADIMPDHVRELRNSFEDRPVLANHLLAVLSTLYAWAMEHNWQVRNPCTDVRRFPVKSDGRKPWPTWAFDVAESSFRPELRRLYFLGRYTGQRLSDCLEMRLEQIDGDYLHVSQSKTGKALRIRTHTRLRPELAAARTDGRLFIVSRPDGTPFSPQDYQAMWGREMQKTPQEKVRKAGLSFHGLRKNAVVALAEAGCTTSQIAAITGQTQKIVEHYLASWNQGRLADQAMDAWEESGL